MDEKGLTHKFKLKAGSFGAEPRSGEMRKRIVGSLGTKPHDIYGLTELYGTGVSFECGLRSWLHINEDHSIKNHSLIIINPKSLTPGMQLMNTAMPKPL